MRRTTGRILCATALAGATLAMLSACGQNGDQSADQNAGAAGENSMAAANDAATDTAATDAAANIPDAACDRQCLIDATDAYVQAMVDHDPSEAPLAGDATIIENLHKIRTDEGLWADATQGPADFVLHVPDEENQTAGYLAVMQRMATPPAPQGSSPEEREEFARTHDKTPQPVIIGLRLKFDGGRIVEAEQLLSDVREAQMQNLQTVRPGLTQEIPTDERLPHDQLIDIGATYYDALDDNNGKEAPFAADCERHENGMITASGDSSRGGGAPGADPNAPHTARDCEAQMDSGAFQYIKTIDDRRVFAADPVTGLVMGLSHFHHPMDNLPYEVTNTDGSKTEQTKEKFAFAPFDLPAAHIFKIGPDGQMHEIEAMGFTAPLDSPTGRD